MHHHYRMKERRVFGHPLLEIVADINGIIGGFALYPQIFNVFQTRNLEGLSTVTFLIIFINAIIWLIYAMNKRITALRISPALNTIGAGMILIFMGIWG